jgi:hypothetical protein
MQASPAARWPSAPRHCAGHARSTRSAAGTIRAVARRAVRQIAMADARITRGEDVVFVQVKCPCITSARRAAGDGARPHRAEQRPGRSMAYARAAGAFGVALALGEIEDDPRLAAGLLSDFASPANAPASRRAWSGSRRSDRAGAQPALDRALRMRCAPMRDALDIGAVARAGAARHRSGSAASAPRRARIAAAFVKCEPDRRGQVRGARHTMLDDTDINAQRHIRGAVGGLVAGVLGDGRIFVSGGAEHQGPDGGGLVAVIAEVPRHCRAHDARTLAAVDAGSLAAGLRARHAVAGRCASTGAGPHAMTSAALNAVVVHWDEDGARAAAAPAKLRWRSGAPLSPLDGVPLTVKDNITGSGLRCRWGSRLFADYVPPRDELPVARCAQAGAVLLGKTNVPEFTLLGYTDNLLFGPTRNPWNPALTPGGSSGGAVAAVAAASARWRSPPMAAARSAGPAATPAGRPEAFHRPRAARRRPARPAAGAGSDRPDRPQRGRPGAHAGRHRSAQAPLRGLARRCRRPPHRRAGATSPAVPSMQRSCEGWMQRQRRLARRRWAHGRSACAPASSTASTARPGPSSVQAGLTRVLAPLERQRRSLAIAEP